MSTFRFRVAIECDNDAFTPQAGREIARILRQIAKEVEHEQDEVLFDNTTNTTSVRDVNGNRVGHYFGINDPD